ncbi:hypothetical protein F5Y15DRAFT_334196 [Xylariaceae sp. FL0016]|nr:hypothetical protein F5Y15DRAFT_334196 [Xylariaceae sp. FL0016]
MQTYKPSGQLVGDNTGDPYGRRLKNALTSLPGRAKKACWRKLGLVQRTGKWQFGPLLPRPTATTAIGHANPLGGSETCPSPSSSNSSNSRLPLVGARAVPVPGSDCSPINCPVTAQTPTPAPLLPSLLPPLLPSESPGITAENQTSLHITTIHVRSLVFRPKNPYRSSAQNTPCNDGEAFSHGGPETNQNSASHGFDSSYGSHAGQHLSRQSHQGTKRSRDEPPDRGRKKQFTSSALSEVEPSGRRKFACPFYKYFGNSSLCGPPYKHRRICDLKQHLDRKHLKIYCPTCRYPFDIDETRERDEHINQRQCRLRDSHDTFITYEQSERMRTIRNIRDERERWYAIWDIIFPGIPHPPSPYAHNGFKDQLWDTHAEYLQTDRFRALVASSLGHSSGGFATMLTDFVSFAVSAPAHSTPRGLYSTRESPPLVPPSLPVMSNELLGSIPLRSRPLMAQSPITTAAVVSQPPHQESTLNYAFPPSSASFMSVNAAHTDEYHWGALTTTTDINDNQLTVSQITPMQDPNMVYSEEAPASAGFQFYNYALPPDLMLQADEDDAAPSDVQNYITSEQSEDDD